MMSLKEFRLESGLKINAIVKRVGISKQSLYDYERGLRKPKFETMVRLAEVYGCTVNDFVGKK